LLHWRMGWLGSVTFQWGSPLAVVPNHDFSLFISFFLFSYPFLSTIAFIISIACNIKSHDFFIWLFYEFNWYALTV
jgi:hypothetical protein